MSLTLFDSLEYFSLRTVFFFHTRKSVFKTEQTLFSHIRIKSQFSFESLMIYLEMRSDSKRDGIKCEQVIFTQACLRSRQMES